MVESRVKTHSPGLPGINKFRKVFQLGVECFLKKKRDDIQIININSNKNVNKANMYFLDN